MANGITINISYRALCWAAFALIYIGGSILLYNLMMPSDPTSRAYIGMALNLIAAIYVTIAMIIQLYFCFEGFKNSWSLPLTFLPLWTAPSTVIYILWITGHIISAVGY